LTHSGRLTHKVVTRQPWIRRRSGKVRRLQTDILTTEPRRHAKSDPLCCYANISTTNGTFSANFYKHMHDLICDVYFELPIGIGEA